MTEVLKKASKISELNGIRMNHQPPTPFEFHIFIAYLRMTYNAWIFKVMIDSKFKCTHILNSKLNWFENKFWEFCWIQLHICLKVYAFIRSNFINISFSHHFHHQMELHSWIIMNSFRYYVKNAALDLVGCKNFVAKFY